MAQPIDADTPEERSERLEAEAVRRVERIRARVSECLEPMRALASTVRALPGLGAFPWPDPPQAWRAAVDAAADALAIAWDETRFHPDERIGPGEFRSRARR